jgi:hypothetical protein
MAGAGLDWTDGGLGVWAGRTSSIGGALLGREGARSDGGGGRTDTRAGGFGSRRS